jgi:hypothetical protein
MRETRNNLDFLVAEYYKWATGQGRMDPQTLLSKCLSVKMRRKLLQAMNDTNVALAFSEYVRAAVLSAETAPNMASTGVPNRG